MSEWNPDDLDAVAAAEEIDISPEGAPVTPVTIWAVRVDDDLFVRAHHAPRALWWRAALASGRGSVAAAGREVAVAIEPADPDLQELVDDAYREKYGASPYGADMLADAVRETTLRLRPAP